MPNPTDEISDMEPYTVSESATLSNEEKVSSLKLDWNESTFPPSPNVKQKLQEFVEKGHFEYYPDVTARKLRENLASYVGCDIDRIQIFNGSDSSIRTLLDTYIDKGDAFLTREPVYTQPYTFVETNGGKCVTFTCESPFDNGVDEFVSVLKDRQPKVAYIPNPNNPTGVCYSEEEINKLLSVAPDTLFVVDEAYYEYAGATVANLVSKFDNLVVSRTLSKAFGLAGCRIGYLVANEKIIQEVDKVRNGKSVNIFGQIAASAALQDVSYMQERVKKVIETRKWLVDSLRDRGYQVVSTPANFILIKISEPEQIVEAMKNENVFIRDRSYLPQLEGYIRVSIGDRDQMERFLKIFEEIQTEMLEE